jgi:hypothetical protein
VTEEKPTARTARTNVALISRALVKKHAKRKPITARPNLSPAAARFRSLTRRRLVDPS